MDIKKSNKLTTKYAVRVEANSAKLSNCEELLGTAKIDIHPPKRVSFI
jgi:hypothetical protein